MAPFVWTCRLNNKFVNKKEFLELIVKIVWIGLTYL